MIELCHHKRKVYPDINYMRTEISQVKFVATKVSLSQQTAQQATRTREEKSIAIKENSVIEIVQESKKSCYNIKKLCHDKIDKTAESKALSRH